MNTPWGKADNIEELSGGVKSVSTAGHGGIYVPPDMNKRIPLVFRKSSFGQNGLKGWYEEDCDWAIPVYFLRGLVDFGRGAAFADKAGEYVRAQHPEAWKEHFGSDVQPIQTELAI